MARKTYLKPAEDVITDLINMANPGRLYKSSELTFGAPAVEEGSNEKTHWNTALEVTNERSGNMTTVYYQRISLDDREGLVGLNIPFNGQLSVSECLPQINAGGGFVLTIEDVLNTSLEGLNGSSLPYTFTLKARPTSLLVIGEVAINIVGVDGDEDAPPPPAPPSPPAPPPPPEDDEDDEDEDSDEGEDDEDAPPPEDEDEEDNEE